MFAGSRKDVNKGCHARVTGMVEGKPVIELEKDGVSIQASVKVENLELLTETDGQDKGESQGAEGKGDKQKPKAPQNMKFLEAGGGESITVVKGWAKKEHTSDPSCEVNHLIHKIGFQMVAIMDALPASDEQDLIIVKRDNVYEVWTNKAVEAGQLVLVPDTTEIKDRYWTASRSVLVGHSSSHHPAKKHMALDGVRRAIPNHDTRPFGVFWLVQRSKDEKEVNMFIGYANVKMDVSIDLPGSKRNIKAAYGEDKLPQIPVLSNTHKLTKHTRLVCGEDLELMKVNEAEQKKMAAEAKKAKKAKASAATSSK